MVQTDLSGMPLANLPQGVSPCAVRFRLQRPLRVRCCAGVEDTRHLGEATVAQLDGADTLGDARAMASAAATLVGRKDLGDDAALVVSELVTNALLHGGGCTGIDIRPIEGGLRVEVRDPSPASPFPGYATEGALTGRGVRVVASLAARWGMQPTPDGKIVWAELTGKPDPAGESVID